MAAARSKSSTAVHFRSEPRPAGPSWFDRGAWIGLGVVLAATACVRWRFLEVPLDRDEGEYAYIAQQWLAGVPPYASGYAMKMPGIYAGYAIVLAIFGQTTRGVHLGFAVVNALAIVLVFDLARRLLGGTLAVIAAAVFAVLTLDVSLQGSTAQAEHFVLAPALLGIWILLIVDKQAAPDHWRSLAELFTAGACFGTALVIKQHGFAFGLFGVWNVVYRWWYASSRRWSTLLQQVGALAVGGAIILAAMCLAMQRAGVFEKFWFWTVTYAGEYAAGIPLRRGLVRLVNASWELFRALPLIWSVTLIGLAAVARGTRWRAQRAFLLALLAFSFLGTCPSLHFWPHAFVLMLPAVALLTAVGCDTAARLVAQALGLARLAETRTAGLVAAVAVIAGSVLMKRDYYLHAGPDAIARMTYGLSPLPEVREIAAWIREHSTESGPFMVLGSEPQIYFYTGRRAASSHIYMYPLMEVQPFARQMQEALAQQVEAARPEWIVFQNMPIAWAQQPESVTWILGWMREYLRREYEPLGLVDLADGGTRYFWLADMARAKPESDAWLLVYRRKDLPKVQTPPQR